MDRNSMNSSDISDLERLTTEYINTKGMADKVNARLDELKQTLSYRVVKEGQEDEKGNLWLPVGTRQLKREKRVSTSFNEGAAEEWAKEQGIFNDVKKVIIKEVLDVDRLLAYAWEHKEVRNTIEGFNTDKVTWAFKVVEKQAFIDES